VFNNSFIVILTTKKIITIIIYVVARNIFVKTEVKFQKVFTDTNDLSKNRSKRRHFLALDRIKYHG